MALLVKALSEAPFRAKDCMTFSEAMSNILCSR